MDKHVLCPILHLVMLHPVFAPDGHTYEEEAILEWVEKSKTSPITREPMKADFKTNFAMLAIIEDYMRANPTATRYVKPVKPKTFSWNEFETMGTFENEKQYILEHKDFRDVFCGKMFKKSKSFGEMLKFLCESFPTAIGCEASNFQNEIFRKVIRWGKWDLFEWFLQKFDTFDTNTIPYHLTRPSSDTYNSFLCMSVNYANMKSEETALKIIQTLIKKGANVNDISIDRPPALCYAIENCLFDVIDYLLECGADAWICNNRSDRQTMCPLIVAINGIASNDDDNAEYLFDLITDKFYDCKKNTKNLVLFAMDNGCDGEAVEYLMNEGLHFKNYTHAEESRIIEYLRNDYADTCDVDDWCKCMFDHTYNALMSTLTNTQNENTMLKKRLAEFEKNNHNKRPKTQPDMA